MAIRDVALALAEQQMPVPNDSPSVQGMVRADLETREAIGIQRYGTVQRVRARELSPLLSAAERHDLWRAADGTSVETCAEFFGVSDPIGEVTEETRLAEAAGLICARPLRPGSGAAWDLTEAGIAALAELRSLDTGSQPSGGAS